MSEPPKPPRPRSEIVPPPLPGSLSGEPFPLADDPPPAFRMRSTPPSGSLLLKRQLETPGDDPRDEVIREMRQVNIILREKLAAMSMPNTTPSIAAPPKSKAVIAGKVGFNLGKYTTLIVGALGLADVVVGLWFPEYVGPLGMLKKALGIP